MVVPAVRFVFIGFVAAAALSSGRASEAKKVTYEDDVLPIFRDNCLKCHNPDKLKGDLDLTSFSGALKGGGSGATLNAGDPDGSQLFKSITHADEPTMPPNGKLADKDIGTIRAWIEGGLLQGAGSKAIAANKPKADLSLKSVSVGKPDGPPPMPAGMSLNPVLHAVHASALSALASSPWAPVVALAGIKQVVLYNTDDLECVGVLPFPEGIACDVKFSRNGRLLLASGGRGGQSGVVIVWDITTGERVITVGDQYDSVLAADISPDQQWIALGGPDRVLKIYRTKDGALEHRIKKHTEWITAVEFSPDGKYLATGDRNGGLVLWETESGHEMFALPGHKGPVTAITWRGDSEVLVSASEDGTLKLWKANDGTAVRSIPAHNGGVLSARFTHDGRIVSCGRDNKVQIWDTTGKNVRTLPFGGDLPNRATFSADGQKAIASDWKGRVFVWDAKSGKALGELDATPPPLAERVQRSTRQIAALQVELEKAEEVHAKSEKAAKASEADAARTKRLLAEARANASAKEAAVKTLTEQLARDAGDEVAARHLADARETISALQSQLASLQSQLTRHAKQAEVATKQAREAKILIEELKTKLESARTALAKWSDALQHEPASSRKVSLR